jgi:hypothetical protein
VRSDAEPGANGVFGRVLLLYGAYSLFHNAAFLVGYHFRPPGGLKGRHPISVIASRIAESSSFGRSLRGRGS